MNTATRTPGIAADLPVPDRTTRIGRPTAEMEAKSNLTAGIMAAVFAVAGAVAYWRGHSIGAYIFGGLGVVLFISIFTKKTDVGILLFFLRFSMISRMSRFVTRQPDAYPKSTGLLNGPAGRDCTWTRTHYKG
jgi:hypothetical protein